VRANHFDNVRIGGKSRVQFDGGQFHWDKVNFWVVADKTWFSFQIVPIEFKQALQRIVDVGIWMFCKHLVLVLQQTNGRVGIVSFHFDDSRTGKVGGVASVGGKGKVAEEVNELRTSFAVASQTWPQLPENGQQLFLLAGLQCQIEVVQKRVCGPSVLGGIGFEQEVANKLAQ